jgi:intein-encoded DNA endonuclease-like protein
MGTRFYQKIRDFPEKVEQIITEYNEGSNILRLSKKYRASQNTIRKIFKENNVAFKRRDITCRKTNADFTFFKNIDTPEKAYWLGFIYADGHCNKRLLSIRLAAKDIGHLEKFKSALKSDHKITEFSEYKHGFCYEGQKTCLFDVGSKEISSDLKALGISGDKTTYSRVPQIPELLYPHFIRGYFDGDGCITYKTGKTAKVEIASNRYVLQDISDIIYKQTGILFKLVPRKESKICWTIKITHRQTIREFMEWLYKDKEISYLDRKYEKFLQFDMEYAQ